MTAIQWAEQKLILPAGSPEPGAYRASRTPYAVPVLEALRRYERVALITGSQMTKTTLVLILMGYTLDFDPAPVLYVGPTQSMINGMIEPRVDRMLKSIPSLAERTDRSRRSQKLRKSVAGVTLRLAWAGSATELSSDPAKLVIVDELDRMKDIPGEGSPLQLADARRMNYADGQLMVTSTPTEGNVEAEMHSETGIEHWKPGDPEKDILSPIWRLWQTGTRHEWAVPCPHCSKYFVPRFSRLWIPPLALDQATSLHKAERIAKRESRLQCPSCDAYIEERHKRAMNAAGRFLAPGQQVIDGEVVGDPPQAESATFWASGLMSPWRSFGERAAKWVLAYRGGDESALRTVMNTDFGECFAFKTEAPPARVVMECRGAYTRGQLPEGAKALLCGVDVQKQRLVYAVRAFGYQMESWLIDWGDIEGRTDEPGVWRELAEILGREYGLVEGQPRSGLRIRRMGIDSGYRPGDKWRRPDNAIYDFCLHHNRAVPTKGRDVALKPVTPSLIDVNWRGKVLKHGLTLWHLDTDYFKSYVQRVIQQERDQRLSRFWVPQDIDEDYCQQLTSETRVPKPSGRAVWIKVRAENHYFDCEVINIAMAYSLGYQRKVAPPTAPPGVATGGQPTAGGSSPGQSAVELSPGRQQATEAPSRRREPQQRPARPGSWMNWRR